MDRKVSKNGFSVGADRLRHATPAQPGQSQGAGKDLVEKFLADLDRSFQEHGREIFHWVLINRPRLYFRALVMLAQVQDRGSSKLSDLDRQRNRAEALLRLELLYGVTGRPEARIGGKQFDFCLRTARARK